MSTGSAVRIQQQLGMPSSNGAATSTLVTFLSKESAELPHVLMDGDLAGLDLAPTRCHDTAELPVARPSAAQKCHVMAAHAQDGESPGTADVSRNGVIHPLTHLDAAGHCLECLLLAAGSVSTGPLRRHGRLV